jgi:lysozyme
MKASQNGINLIKEFEGLRLSKYDDVTGHATIGYGTLWKEGMPDICTAQEAEEWLKEECVTIEKALATMVMVPLNQNQFDALISFCYNIGTGAFAGSTLLRLLNQGEYDAAAAQFPRWVLSHGERYPGLVRRREREKELFSAIPAQMPYEEEPPKSWWQKITEFFGGST